MQQIVDCDTSDDGCGGGDPPTAYQYVIGAGGLESYADYPYTAEDGQCAFNAGEIARKISSWQWVTQSQNEQAMQQIVDCDTSDDGCNGGDPPTAYQYVIGAPGLEGYTSYPYTAEDGYCAFSAASVIRKISSWQWVTQSQDEGAMQSFTYSNGPPSVCVDASSWDSYNGGVYTSSNCGTQLDHCVQIVGWDVQQGMNVWVVRNSWGTSWGYSGYLYVAMGQDACGIAQECTSAIC